ncbi:MAG: 2-succinyl-5-enolpyruvyl-6-hydroxy-3-cyclohexene-1-carboxylic-acid synthase [Tychonema bourrellyi B0820]|uniref:2-succinyl-5-enolpyruvyl-6-hydroxy-3-cyclohexene-1-carboxylate synthase n=1 Tax=Tychonema bourrellyi FEM_GT703 TaxID=2040638 RepID=A0A2G4EYT3_9CYAN|nr:2-succinyl-5-enolpyruvyl-6-hydroxy-3-cyclohexene-1-carboxylic-acid synthase [Tychonema bourrellyi]MDQ2098870.1 2-succinyl-5-enolpyruvyl-6-hydroxy-3-cyclohexene-1-carboxylic-acid synthase [Tychonema bourrellyi B0820]PHX54650.1 2-succinyl-5-enolpyruvyl-6-hydroxy-3-cyclohexene-1-carboxylic-acid synthase [Tychonema bourrellyi FEM_GT703]
MIDFRNTNTLWSSILAETLQRLGLTTAVICPGSRSAPLTIAFAQNNQIETIPILDERSASFFALGIAKKSHLPTALICTSGTAAANFYPAIIEARESRIPLLIFTADRPPELRDCHAGQAIDQIKIYGNYPNWQVELAIPSAEIAMLGYLRQTIIYAWDRSQFPTPGPVHLNIPFRDPLIPISDIAVEALETQFNPEDFFAGLEPIFAGETSTPPSPPLLRGGEESTIQQWQKCSRGIIIAGVAQPQFPEKYCSAIAQMSKLLNWPVLAEGLSPLRNYAQLNPHLISTYDLILRNRELADKLTPEIAIQIGDLPTSKELRNWLDKTQPKRYIIDPSHHNFDPLHGKTIHLRTSPENLATAISLHVPPLSKGGLGGVQDRGNHGGIAPTDNETALGLGGVLTSPSNEYLQLWHNTETQVRQTIDQKLSAINNIIEPKISWLLSQNLPAGTPIFISNSMPVRDVEFFWKPNNLEIKPFFNRGANGIDGTLSTALGVAHRNQSSILLTGDLALLHDTNGFLIKHKFVGYLTIILINNNGGGIFEMLPVAKFDPPFEEFFATPQHINFAQLCATYSVEHEIINDWEQLKEKLSLPSNNGIRVLELQTDRRVDAKWRQNNLSKFAQGS